MRSSQRDGASQSRPRRRRIGCLLGDPRSALVLNMVEGIPFAPAEFFEGQKLQAHPIVLLLSEHGPCYAESLTVQGDPMGFPMLMPLWGTMS